MFQLLFYTEKPKKESMLKYLKIQIKKLKVKILKLNKALYGLKQASRTWNENSTDSNIPIQQKNHNLMNKITKLDNEKESMKELVDPNKQTCYQSNIFNGFNKTGYLLCYEIIVKIY